MLNRYFMLCVLLSCLLLQPVVILADGLNIYLVRHAQTESNASGVNDKRSSSTFSSAGIAQIAQLTETLKKYKFDAVLVSPTERTLNTIAPYLKITGMTGIIWPEVTECCWQEKGENVSEGNLVWGKDIYLPPEISSQFSFREDIPARNYANRNYADGLAQIHQATKLIKNRFGGTSQAILIVTHYHAGALLIAELLGIERSSLPGLENAQINKLQQNIDGSFNLLTINGQPR